MGHLTLNHRVRYRAVLDGDRSAVNADDDRDALIEQMTRWGYSLERGDYLIEEVDVERSDRCLWCKRLD